MLFEKKNPLFLNLTEAYGTKGTSPPSVQLIHFISIDKHLYSLLQNLTPFGVFCAKNDHFLCRLLLRVFVLFKPQQKSVQCTSPQETHLLSIFYSILIII